MNGRRKGVRTIFLLNSSDPFFVFDPFFVLAAALLFGSVSVLEAHPISLSWANAFVTREKVTVKLEVFAEDLFMFQGIEPNEQNYLEPDDLAEAVEKHKKFLLDYFVLLDVHGEPLAGQVVGVQRGELDAKGLHMADLMAYSIFYELVYPLAQPPEFLTVLTRFGGDTVALPSLMQLNVQQEGAGTPQVAELQAGQPHTMRFDWDYPPLSPTASQEEWDAWATKIRDKTLGITSYSSIYSFIYINDYEVRHEVLIPLLTLETWFPIERKDKSFLEVEEQDSAREKIEEFFGQGNPVMIDGIEVKPVVDRVDFYGLDFTDFAMQSARRRVSAVNARVGVILSYATKGPPSELTMTWDKFNWEVWAIRSVVFAYNESSRAEFFRDSPTFEWTSSERPPIPPITKLPAPAPPPKLSVPVVSLVCMLLGAAALAGTVLRRAGRKYCAAGVVLFGLAAVGTWSGELWSGGRMEVDDPLAPVVSISDGEARAIFGTLLKNVYRAFDYRCQSDVYDALARSVDGRLLTELYLDIRKGLEMQEQGGAVSRVQEVKIVDGHKESPSADNEEADPRSFRFRSTWTVNGTVEHWGHIHARTNEYEALFTVQPRENAWKITALEVLGQRRVKFQTSLRQLGSG